MNSIELGVFAAVARAGSIGRAAERLNTVQSNVTQRLRAFEDRLGVTLFHRSRRGVTLTTVGVRLLPYATRVAELLEEARLAVRDDAVPSGEVRIGATETVAAFRLPIILGTYAALHPQVDVAVDTGPTEHLVERVLRRELDGAFVSGPVAHPQLQAVAVFEEELVLITSPRVSSVEDLGRDGSRAGKMIAFRAGCSYRQRTEAFLAREGLLGLPRMEIGTLDGMVGCVAAGVGFALLPRAVVDEAAAAGRVRVHILPAEIARTATVFVQRLDAFITAALRCFLDCATGRVAQAAPGPVDAVGGTVARSGEATQAP